MSKKNKVPKCVGEFITAIDAEGLDYAITDYCDTKAIMAEDMVLAGAVDAFKAIRKAIIGRLADYGYSDE